MRTYSLDSDSIFIGRSTDDPTTIRVYELDDLNSGLVKCKNFEYLLSVGFDLSYDALEIFGVVISGSALKRLAETLHDLRLVVNREGFCYFRAVGVVDPSSGVEIYRLNDLFNWFDYGVIPSITTHWNRCDIWKGGALISYRDQRKSLEECRNDLDVKEKEIKKLCEKVEELKDVRRELSVAETELKSTKRDLELSKAEVVGFQVELKLLNKKGEEVEKVRSELFDAKVELKFTKSELESSKAKVAELQSELKFTKSELDSLKTMFAALQVEMSQYHAEAKLKSSKMDWNHQKGEVVELKKELNHCHSQFPTIVVNENNSDGSGSTPKNTLDIEAAAFQTEPNNFHDILIASHGNSKNFGGCHSSLVDPLEILLCRQIQIPSTTFIVETRLSPCLSPHFGVSGDDLRQFTVLDDDVSGLFPTNVYVHTNFGYIFDSNNWWFVRAVENNQRVMLAVYGGAVDVAGSFGTAVAIPFCKGAGFQANKQFFVSLVHGIGFRFVFIY